MLQPDAFCEYIQCSKCDCGRGSAPDPAGGASPDSVAGFKGRGRKGGEWRGEEGKGRRGAGREGKGGRGGEVDSDAQLEQGSRLAKAGPESGHARWGSLQRSPRPLSWI